MSFFEWLTPELRIELQDGSFNPGATTARIDELCSRLGFTPPADYRAFLQESDGAAFHLGDSFVVLASVEELPLLNNRHHVATRAPGLILFGTNAASDGFGFDTRATPHPIVVCSLDEPNLEDAIPQGTNLTAFLERVRSDIHLTPASAA